MAAQANGIFPLTFKAPLPVLPRRCVGFGGGMVSTPGAKVAGVSEHGADAGAYYVAQCVGTAVVEAGAAIAVGDSLIADAQGRAVPSSGALAMDDGATPVTSSTASGPLVGADLPEFVFADALEAAPAAGAFVEVLLRR